MAEKMGLPPYPSNGTSFLKTCISVMTALSGIGLTSISYALSQGGWLSLLLLFVTAILTCFTVRLLQRCVDSNPFIKTYPDIGWCAFGHKGRIILSAFMYLEHYLVPARFLILEGNILHKLYPDVGFEVGGHYIGARQCFVIMVGLAVLTLMCFNKVGAISLISASGICSCIISMGAIFWVGAVDVGFSGKGELFNLGGIPTEIRFYAFCYCVHPAFPAIYSSMKDRSQFSKVLVICFSLSTLIYTSIAILGYSMFGQNVMYPVLIFNLPVGEISSKIAIYFMLAAPLPRYAMMSRRLATVMESCLPSYYNNKPMSLLIRSLLLISTVIVALAFPFSVYLMTPTIAFLSVTASILLPCICYLKIFEVYRMWGYELVILVGVMILGISIGCMSIYSSIKEMVMHF